MSRPLSVWLDTRLAATVERSQSGLALTYDADYWKDGLPLSLSLPLRETPHRGAYVEHWLHSHLPDNKTLVRRWSDRAQSSDVVVLLSTRLGLDCAGAIRFSPKGTDPDELGGSLVEMSSDEVEEEMAWVIAGMPGREMSDLYCSLPGFHPKLALRQIGDRWARPTGSEASTHILKPRSRHEKIVPVTEFLMTDSAGQCGLETPLASLESHGSMTVFVVERYDRECHSGRWRRLHQEDFGQAMGLAPERRSYASGGPGVEEMARVLRSATTNPEESLRALADGLLWAWITADIDAHARNYALLWDNSPAPGLAPLYDRNTSLPFKKQAVTSLDLAMPYGETDSIGALDGAIPSSLAAIAAALSLTASDVHERCRLIAEQAPDALSDAMKTLAKEHKSGIRGELRCLQSRLAERCKMFLAGGSPTTTVPPHLNGKDALLKRSGRSRGPMQQTALDQSRSLIAVL